MSDDQLIILYVVLGLVTVLSFGGLAFFFLRGKKKPEVLSERDHTQDFKPPLEKLPEAIPSSRKEPEPARPAVSQPVVPQQRTISDALSSTRSSFFGRLKNLFSTGPDEDHRDALEEILYTSDLGPRTVQKLMNAVEEKVGTSWTFDSIQGALKTEMRSILETTDQTPLSLTGEPSANLKIWMIVGVNGAGKTTTIGKLAHKLAAKGEKVLIAAGDTFRAAAGEQLKVWSERAKVEIFYPDGVTSPSAVAFDACNKAQGGGFTSLIIDTAGRLHTQKPLMEELKKMRRVVEKAIPGAPHEVLLVLDANAGLNALIQAKEFHEALQVTGVVLTKMDGSAKGGVAIGVACELGIPVKLIGIGEAIEDLRPFSPQEFVDAII